MKHQQKITGFTIVELLIVIVVIAILAATSIVAFNGIQDRAKNTQLLASVDAAEKILRLYSALHGRHPATFNPNTNQNIWGGPSPYVCLGKASDYPATSDFGAGECGIGIDGGSEQVYARHQPELEQQLATVASELSVDAKNSTVVIPGSGKQRGIIYYGYNDLEGREYISQIMYMQKGDKACGRGEKVFHSPGPGTLPEGITNCALILGGIVLDVE